MYPAEEHYYDSYYSVPNKMILKFLGMWPHKRSWITSIQRALAIFVVATHVCLQLLNFLVADFEMSLFVKTLSIASPGWMILLKYCLFILKSKIIDSLHYQIQKDWAIMQDKMENAIMQKYAHEVQTLVIILIYSGTAGFVIGMILQFLPIILDVIAPLDMPRPRRILVPVEFLLLHDEYFYVKVAHEAISTAVGGLILLATGSQLLVFVYHSLGMFKIASHRVEYSIENIILKISDPTKMECEIRKGIILTVIAHRRAMEFADAMISSFNVQFCILAIVGVISTSITFYRFVNAVTVTRNVEDIILSFGISLGFLMYMYLANYMGQKVNDHNTEIFKSTYSVSWYLMPVSSQKLILLLMQKCSKDFYFTIGYIFVARIESFAMLVNSALSYLTLMYSI